MMTNFPVLVSMAAVDAANSRPQALAFCPAAACAEQVARLETYLDLVHRGLDQAAMPSTAMPGHLLEQIGAHADEIAMQLDEARTRLADTAATSPTGALAQLLAAIRDIRVGDDGELARARRLEAQARDFMARARLMEPETAAQLSRTKTTAL